MNKNNYHTHTTRCYHASGKDEEYVKAAIKAGIKELGFSDHTPWHYDSSFKATMRMPENQLDGYIESILSLKEKYKDQISILVGLECEYFEKYIPWLKQMLEDKKIHYIIRGFWPLIADYMCACSSEAGNWLFGRKNVEKGKVEILKNGIIGTQYYYNKNTRNEYREKLGWQNNLIVGHVGRFSEQKNHTFLIDVIAEMYKVNPSVRAVLFGIGDLKNDMEQKVEQLGLKSIIKFPGTSPEINKYLQAMDLFLFPSLYEGLPVVGIEAQAAGIWVLASDTISPELKITDKVHWMSLSKPASCWAEKGLELLNQVSERDTALEIKEAGYDIEFTAKRLKDIYES